MEGTSSYGDINNVLREARQNRLRRSIGEARTFLYGAQAISVKEFKEFSDRSSVSDVEEVLTNHLYQRIQLSTKDGRNEFFGKNVIQLGSGVGLAGIFVQKMSPSANVTIAESLELTALVKENVESNGEIDGITVEPLEWDDDLKQKHINNRCFDYVVAILDIFNTPALSEKIFKIIVELSGNGSLLLLGYKRYLKPLGKINVVEDFNKREEVFREILGHFFNLRTSRQKIYSNSPTQSSEIVIFEIVRTSFSTFFQREGHYVPNFYQY